MYAPAGYLEAFRTSIESSTDLPQTSIQLSVGTGIDETAWDDLSSIQAGSLPMSSVAQLKNKVYSLAEGQATFERDGIPTDPSAEVVAPPLSDPQVEIGVWSDVISDGNGAFSGGWNLTVNLSAPHTTALTVYSDQVLVTSATVQFYLGSQNVGGGNLTIDGNRAVWGTPLTYDRAVLTILSIDQPYSHARIAEVDFGAMVPVSSDYLGDRITWVEEYDPLQQTLPLNELDFSVVNIDGIWDDDASSSEARTFTVGALIVASMRAEVNGTLYTLPLGRFTIAEKRAEEDEVVFICYDLRHLLKGTVNAIQLTQGASLGLAIGTALGASNIPHEISSEVVEIIVDQDYPLTDDSTFEAMLMIQQRWGVFATPGRDGLLHITLGRGSGAYGTMPKGQMIDYPKPANGESYNYISVSYGGEGQEYVIDLRDNTSLLKSVLSFRNPLIRTSAQAQTLAETIQSAVYSQEREVACISDGSLDSGDSIGLYGRHSDTASSLRVKYVEMTYDGGLTATLRAIV